MNFESIDAVIDEIPAGRIGTADEVAKLSFDLNTQNHYLTGQIIVLDGGWI